MARRRRHLAAAAPRSPPRRHLPLPPRMTSSSSHSINWMSCSFADVKNESHEKEKEEEVKQTNAAVPACIGLQDFAATGESD